MSLPLIFTFAPIPLTDKLSPLAHAAALARKRQAEKIDPLAVPRTRVSLPSASVSRQSASVNAGWVNI